MLIPVVSGAALGNAATSAIVGGGVNLVSEVSGELNTDVMKLAGEVAERARAI